MNLSKKKLTFSLGLIFFLLFSVSFALAMPDSTVKMLERFHISLGNDTCLGQECDLATLMFYVPSDEGAQDVRLTITPECFNYTFGGGDQWDLIIFCQNGNSTVYDMKTAMCDYDQSLTMDLTIESTGYSFFSDKQFQQFWCAFKRDPDNVNDLPTEFNVLVDGVGLHSKFIDTKTEQNFQSQISFATAINNLANMNISVWDIVYSIFLIGAILFGIFFVVGFIPIAIRYVIRKVTEDDD